MDGKVNTQRWIYWKAEPEKRKWTLIPDTQQARKQAIKLGAMYFTWAALSEPYKGNGQPEPHRWGDFPNDFDDSTNPDTAIADGRQLCFIHLPQQYDVDPYCLRYFHSGSRGPHIEIPAQLFGAEGGDPYLPLIFKKISCEWATKFNLPSMDLSLFCMGLGKMFRIPNVRRKNGRYKVRLTKDEFQSLSYNELLELTKAPREIESADVDLVPNEALVELFQRARAEVYCELQSYGKESNLTPEQISKLSKQIPACMDYILSGKLSTKTTQINFNKLVMLAVTFFRSVGWDENTALQKSQGLIERFTDSDHYDTPDKRKDHFRSQWKYLNGKGKFSCSYVLGLKLPGRGGKKKKPDRCLALGGVRD